MMPYILVDSNVLLDVITEDKKWFEWSSAAIARHAEENTLAINQIIYSEVSIRFNRIEDLESALPENFIARLPIPWEAAFLAGKCFLQYKQRGGIRRSTLPDFFIGAHAIVADLPLITRDTSRYRTYFPKMRLIAPEQS